MRFSSTRNIQSGFTLIELLTVIFIIGVLAGLGLQALSAYKTRAGYASAIVHYGNARNAVEAGITSDNAPGSVSYFTQNSPGPISDSSGSLYLPGMMLGQKVQFSAEYDPTCTDGTCVSDIVEVRHCQADQYVRWMRTGDGMETLQEHLSGTASGCS